MILNNIVTKEDLKCVTAWTDSYGNTHTHDEMSTLHLYNTFMSIWNNCTPKEYRYPVNEHFVFPPYAYPEKYLAITMIAIYNALMKRDELVRYQKERIDNCYFTMQRFQILTHGEVIMSGRDVRVFNRNKEIDSAIMKNLATKNKFCYGQYQDISDCNLCEFKIDCINKQHETNRNK